MFDQEPRSQTQVPTNDIKFTLDEFQKEIAEQIQKMKDGLLATITKGVEAKLDSEIMLSIINRELAKVGEGI